MAYFLVVVVVIVLFGSIVKDFSPNSVRLNHIGGMTGSKRGYIRVSRAPEANMIHIGESLVEVVRCEVVSDKKRSLAKAVVGAAIGDAIGGVPGAVGGGLVGGRLRNVPVTALTARVNGMETVIYFRTTAQEHQRLLGLL